MITTGQLIHDQVVNFFIDIYNGKSVRWIGKVDIIEKDEHFMELRISGRGSSFLVIVGRYINGHFLCIPELNVGCALSRPDNILWNLNRVSGIMNIVDAVTVVYGIAAASGGCRCRTERNEKDDG